MFLLRIAVPLAGRSGPWPASSALRSWVSVPVMGCPVSNAPGTALDLRHAGLARGPRRALSWLAGDWPGVDWQAGVGALEVVVEHDG